MIIITRYHKFIKKKRAKNIRYRQLCKTIIYRIFYEGDRLSVTNNVRIAHVFEVVFDIFYMPGSESN